MARLLLGDKLGSGVVAVNLDPEPHMNLGIALRVSVPVVTLVFHEFVKVLRRSVAE